MHYFKYRSITIIVTVIIIIILSVYLSLTLLFSTFLREHFWSLIQYTVIRLYKSEKVNHSFTYHYQPAIFRDDPVNSFSQVLYSILNIVLNMRNNLSKNLWSFLWHQFLPLKNRKGIMQWKYLSLMGIEFFISLVEAFQISKFHLNEAKHEKLYFKRGLTVT